MEYDHANRGVYATRPDAAASVSSRTAARAHPSRSAFPRARSMTRSTCSAGMLRAARGSAAPAPLKWSAHPRRAFSSGPSAADPVEPRMAEGTTRLTLRSWRRVRRCDRG